MNIQNSEFKNYKEPNTMTIVPENIHSITLITGSNGKKGCTSNCLGCYLGKYGEKRPFYQGSMSQVHELISILPNLKRVALFGNPDVSVDSAFCNEVAKVLQEKNIIVYFFTSGVGGISVTKQILNGLNKNNVGRMYFSIDTLDDDKLTKIKGTKASHKNIFSSIEYCNQLGIETGIIATLWSINMDEDLIAFIDFWKSLGVAKVKIHYGSVEAAAGKIDHIPLDKVLGIREKYGHKVRLPYIFATDNEYEIYLSRFVATKEVRCCNFSGEVFVYLEEDGIKWSLNCSIATTIHPEYITDIKELNLPLLSTAALCPVAEYALGYKCHTMYPVCRYYKDPK
jgi:MoaA/NifB/PqqE/SkfB family radical SAM enzyme